MVSTVQRCSFPEICDLYVWQSLMCGTVWYVWHSLMCGTVCLSACSRSWLPLHSSICICICICICDKVFACPLVQHHDCLHVRVLVAEIVGLVSRQDFCKKEIVEAQAKIKSSRIDSSKYQIAPGLFFHHSSRLLKISNIIQSSCLQIPMAAVLSSHISWFDIVLTRILGMFDIWMFWVWSSTTTLIPF